MREQQGHSPSVFTHKRGGPVDQEKLISPPPIPHHQRAVVGPLGQATVSQDTVLGLPRAWGRGRAATPPTGHRDWAGRSGAHLGSLLPNWRLVLAALGCFLLPLTLFFHPSCFPGSSWPCLYSQRPAGHTTLGWGEQQGGLPRSGPCLPGLGGTCWSLAPGSPCWGEGASWGQEPLLSTFQINKRKYSNTSLKRMSA